ncbi:geranylgeranyl transferase type-2 subunit alpha [Podospora australis]|uniref:Geranylgeranyl transferase type-2 subunit alpha n=1 Tax=Podospora australis TaxID=1536484 RepID=A0AAN7AG73_9PEZI|nr:geranylgeranyl transferase type-2 subunit alpha [Podospora australis]
MADQGGSQHGIARTSRVRTEAQRQSDLDRIQKYKDLESQLRSLVQSQGADPQEIYTLTTRLLRLNPEYYTVWNVRRRALISGLFSRPSPGSSCSKASSSFSASDTTTTSTAASSPSSSTAATRPSPPSPTAGRSGTTLDNNTPSENENKEKEKNEEEDLKLLETELNFTIPLLLESPKCYWIWSYRLWLLRQAIERLSVAAAKRIWEAELKLAGKMLSKDPRNFHAWGYRRHVVETLESKALNGTSLVEQEFAYTTRMIESKLSNFSAWHSRSKLIPRLLDERGADENARRGFLDQELGYIRRALNVGPEDQSLWYYHQFLVLNIVSPVGHPTIVPGFSLEDRVTYMTRELEEMKDLLEDYDDEKLIYEALLEYTLYLCGLEGRKPEPEERDDLVKWLTKLKELDPMRNGRWADLERDQALTELLPGVEQGGIPILQR